MDYLVTLVPQLSLVRNHYGHFARKASLHDGSLDKIHAHYLIDASLPLIPYFCVRPLHEKIGSCGKLYGPFYALVQ